MEKKLDPNSWMVNGRCFKPDNDKRFIDGEIIIKEEVSNLRMGPRHSTAAYDNTSEKEIEPFGKPVDANLAIDLIKNAIQVTKPLVNDFFNKEHEDLTENERSIYELLNLSYGVTFDKALILKILSQPNCAGLRSYICARKPTESSKKALHVSLVMVGIDSAGFDLSYATVNLNGNDVPTVSLIAEYGYPPDENKKLDWAGDPKNIDEHYILLRHAAIKEEKEK